MDKSVKWDECPLSPGEKGSWELKTPYSDICYTLLLKLFEPRPYGRPYKLGEIISESLGEINFKKEYLGKYDGKINAYLYFSAEQNFNYQKFYGSGMNFLNGELKEASLICSNSLWKTIVSGSEKEIVYSLNEIFKVRHIDFKKILNESFLSPTLPIKPRDAVRGLIELVK